MLQDALRKTARRLDTLEEGRATEAPGIWQSFTPGLFQGVAISVIIQYARYCVIGKIAFVQGRLAATSAGSGGGTNPIIVTGLPIARVAGAVSGEVGTFRYFDGTQRAGSAELTGGQTDLYGLINGNAWPVGILPAITVAIGHVVLFNIVYEID